MSLVAECARVCGTSDIDVTVCLMSMSLVPHTRAHSATVTRARPGSASTASPEPVTAAICQLARQLEDNGTPIDYARRPMPRLAQAQLDVTAWRRQRHILRL